MAQTEATEGAPAEGTPAETNPLAEAVALHNAGKTREAERAYRSILKEQPNNADALHLLGILAIQVGKNQPAADLIERAIKVDGKRPEFYINRAKALTGMQQNEAAVSSCRRAIALKPDHPGAHVNMGNALVGLQAHDEAVASYRRAIALQPDNLSAHCNMGVALRELGKLEDSVASYRAALKLQPDHVETHSNIANVLKQMGDLDAAEAHCRYAIGVRPDYVSAYCNLGVVLMESEKLDEAEAAHRKALEIAKNYPQALCGVGMVLKRRGRLDDAIPYFKKAIDVRPNMAEAHSHLGNARQDQGRLEEAVACHRRAIELNPRFLDAHNNLGNALKDLCRMDEAIASYRRAVEVAPDHASAHWNLALGLLVVGEWQEGWKEFEWRWGSKGLKASQRNFDKPLWDGGDLDGRTLLLHAEQGVGDSIQFVRYVALAADRRGADGRVVVEHQPGLERLFAFLSDRVTLIPFGDALPPFDVHAPFLSLPYVFGTTTESVPADVPYLEIPDDAAVDLSGGTGFKVGLVWAGNPKHLNDRNRSADLKAFAPLLEVAGCSFYSLQVGKRQADLADLGFADRITDLADQLTDFTVTEAAIRDLDLVITVDTAVAHLAGALGRPVWLLLPFAPDWRWLMDREDTPWYPTMRLFRQSKRGDWREVMGRVADALREQADG